MVLTTGRGIIRTVSVIDRANGFGFRRLIAAGGYRSGSTLQYNLIGAYFERLGIGRRFGLVDPDDVARLAAETAGNNSISVVKSHHAVGDYQMFARPTAWVEEMQAGRARALTTRRDITAVRHSMVRKFGLTKHGLDSSPFWLSNLRNEQRWKELGAHEQAYELLTEHPVDAVKDACEFLHVPWSREAASGAADDSSIRTAIETMARLTKDTYDHLTLVHWDHVDTAALKCRADRCRTGRLAACTTPHVCKDSGIGSLEIGDRLST